MRLCVLWVIKNESQNGDRVDRDRIIAFLDALGKRYLHPARLFLLGGSALCLLGNPRPTLDIDYVGDDLTKYALQKSMETLAHKMYLDIEAVPIAQFIPMPAGEEERSLPAGKFGGIDVFILDPYCIVLSKLKRGFDTDMEDVVFLMNRNMVKMDILEPMLVEVLKRAREFDIDSHEVNNHLEDLRDLLEQNRNG